MQRAIANLIGFCLLNMVAGWASAQPTLEPGKPVRPKVYALVAAVGAQFSFVHEVQSTGTHLSPYRRTTSNVPNDILNRLALNGLDGAIAKADPGGKRIYLALAASSMDGVAPPQRESVAIGNIVSALERMPERLEWDRIVVATPAYRALAQNGVASKLQGFGIFSEPLCQAGCDKPFSKANAAFLDAEPPDGVEAITSENKTIKARTYLAPFSYITVWVLDPKTLAVLDKQQAFDNLKLAEPRYKPRLDVTETDFQKYIATRIAQLVEASIGEAVMRSEINGKHGEVEVGDVKVVTPPDDARK
jgi:hypothetical protein